MLEPVALPGRIVAVRDDPVRVLSLDTGGAERDGASATGQTPRPPQQP